MKYLILCLLFTLTLFAKVQTGIDNLFKEENISLIQGKRVGLITNQTGINSALRSSVDLFKEKANLVALFCPEHGLNGLARAGDKVSSTFDPSGIPIHSLYGATRRPTAKMLEGVDILIFDIQDIGVRSYTYATTLFYAMEEAAKLGIAVLVLDRPNPLGGLMIDGPMLCNDSRSFLGYINVPYCHGMTIGELALFFNGEYKIGCNLKVVPMQGWERSMTFKETSLAWIPTSPNIPESDTPLFYASTGILGELELVNIGIGYTLPFKIVGAPWINANSFAEHLNSQKMAGVHFIPFYFRPFFGAYKDQDCQGVKILVTSSEYRPLSVQYLLIGMLKSLYSEKVESKLLGIASHRRENFCKVNGNQEMFNLLINEKYVAWKLIEFQKDERAAFLQLRQKYLLY